MEKKGVRGRKSEVMEEGEEGNKEGEGMRRRKG